jgi:hypothetical protein
MDGLPSKPSAYLRWGIIEDISLDDISYPGNTPSGGRSRDIYFTYARSVSIKWLDGPGGRDSVKFIEPIGVTSVPMKGSVVAVLSTGPSGEPVIIGSWTQAYKSKQLTELANLNPGQEIWRKAGLAIRIIPYYDDLRSYAEQYSKSPWTLDLIMGEQHDQACFCPTCQTRYPANSTKIDGKDVYSCPTYCEVCAENKNSSKLILVRGSVAAGEGAAWAAMQADLLLSSILRGIYAKADSNVLGVYIKNKSAQQDIRSYFRRYLYNELGPTYQPDISDFFVTQGTNLWKELLTTYVKTGDIPASTTSDIPDIIGNSLIVTLKGYLDGWINTNLNHYMLTEGMGKISEDERKLVLKALNDNITTYITEYLPGLLTQSFQQFIYNTSRTYISENVALLRKKATNWVYDLALKGAESGIKSLMKGWLGEQLPGFKKAYFDITTLPNEIINNIAKNDLIKLLDKGLDRIQDPEELPIMELRVNQDLSAVVDTQLGREEGKGDKAARLRVKIYRDGAMKLQVQESVFLNIDPDGTVDLQCNELNLETNKLFATLSERSQIYPKEKLQIGLPDKDYKPVTLDKDNVREYEGSPSLRSFIEDIAWKHVASKLTTMFGAAAITCDTATVPDVAAGIAFADMVKTTLPDSLLPGPASNSIIGKTESSSIHIDGN